MKRFVSSSYLRCTQIHSSRVYVNNLKSSASICLTQRRYHVHRDVFKYTNKFLAPSLHLLGSRRSASDDETSHNKPPLLMKFQPALRPEFFLSMRNWFLAKFIIQPYLDNDFLLKEFTRGAKQALTVVSALLSQGDFQSLKGLVVEEAISEVQRNYSLFNLKQRQELAVKASDVLFTFPYQIGISIDDSGIKRFAEITVVYHCLNGLEELKAVDKKFMESSKDEITICNYRFIREYTKGVQSNWTINRIGHFKLIHLEQ